MSSPSYGIEHEYPGRALLAAHSQRLVPWVYYDAVRATYEHVCQREAPAVGEVGRISRANFEAMHRRDRRRCYLTLVATLIKAIAEPVECSRAVLRRVNAGELRADLLPAVLMEQESDPTGEDWAKLRSYWHSLFGYEPLSNVAKGRPSSWSKSLPIPEQFKAFGKLERYGTFVYWQDHLVRLVTERYELPFVEVSKVGGLKASFLKLEVIDVHSTARAIRRSGSTSQRRAQSAEQSLACSRRQAFPRVRSSFHSVHGSRDSDRRLCASPASHRFLAHIRTKQVEAARGRKTDAAARRSERR